jgi:predicted membrane GTPase involved in stress response
MLATQLHYDNHFGKYVTGKVVRGYAKIGDQIKIYDQNKKLVGE